MAPAEEHATPVPLVPPKPRTTRTRRVATNPTTERNVDPVPQSALTATDATSAAYESQNIFLARLSQRFLETYQLNERKHYARLAAESQARGGTEDEAAIRGYIQEARRRKLLTSPGNGEIRLTPKALLLLLKHERSDQREPSPRS